MYYIHYSIIIYLACANGYTGLSCEIKCPFPSYGIGCQSECNCIDKACDHVKGCTQSSRGIYASSCSIQYLVCNLQYIILCNWCMHHVSRLSDDFFNKLGLQDYHNGSIKFQSPYF